MGCFTFAFLHARVHNCLGGAELTMLPLCITVIGLSFLHEKPKAKKFNHYKGIINKWDLSELWNRRDQANRKKQSNGHQLSTRFMDGYFNENALSKSDVLFFRLS